MRRVQVWPTHKARANRRRRPRPSKRGAPEMRLLTTDAMARNLVRQGVCSPRILGTDALGQARGWEWS